MEIRWPSMSTLVFFVEKYKLIKSIVVINRRPISMHINTHTYTVIHKEARKRKHNDARFGVCHFIAHMADLQDCHTKFVSFFPLTYEYFQIKYCTEYKFQLISYILMRNTWNTWKMQQWNLGYVFWSAELLGENEKWLGAVSIVNIVTEKKTENVFTCIFIRIKKN